MSHAGAPTPRTTPTPSAPHAAPAIELRDVFRVHRTAQGDAAALQGASLVVEVGEMLCVLGPSGAGKSTLLRMIAGLEVPSAGTVRVLGREMGRLSPRARGALRRAAIGWLSQRSELHLPPDLLVEEGVALGLALRGVARAGRARRARELMEAVGVGDCAGARPQELSGGERQRLALCAALAHRPALLLADEPTGELDADSAAAVRRLLVQQARAQGMTVVVVSHDPQAAVGADRAIRLRDGRVGEERRDGTEALVVDRGGWVRLPTHLLAAAGIGARARADGRSGELILRPAAGGEEDLPGSEARGRPPSRRPRISMPMQIRAVSKAFGTDRARRIVIQNLSASFAAGRWTAITGPSGSGKSTLLALLAGLSEPDAGEVCLGHRTLSGCSSEQRAALRRAHVGYMSQDAGLVPFLAAEENVALALEMHGHRGPDSADRVAAALQQTGLSDRARQRISRLSAGERQRVALARALAVAGGVLIVDEPTSRLDEAAVAVVAQALASAAADGTTVICATHEPALIARADDVLSL